MGVLDQTGPGGILKGVPPLLPHEMDHIRRVFEEGSKAKRHDSIISPREDAQMFRNKENHSSPCECIVELYELLWRWGHRTPERTSFAQNFGFAIPDTIVIVKGRPYAWYFMSKKDGRLLRKSDNKLLIGAIEKKFCKDPSDEEQQKEHSNVPCGAWMPMASQFPEARCHSPNAEFLSVSTCRYFLTNLRHTHSGILQLFVEPHGVSNFLVRTVEFRRQTSICVRTNRCILDSGRGNLFDRSATFEGWEGLSSVGSRYRNYRHPHMEELIVAAGETLNRRIETERVRQMLFLGPHQHIALHFKVGVDNTLYFIFASIVSEKDVILQTKPQLLMGDPCMTEELPGVALLLGGTTRKMPPHEAPACYSARGAGFSEKQDSTTQRDRSLPPIRPSPRPTSGPERDQRARPMSDRRHLKDSQATVIPRMEYTKPEIPVLPYKTIPIGNLEEPAYYEGALPRYAALTSFKRPLILPTDQS